MDITISLKPPRIGVVEKAPERVKATPPTPLVGGVENVLISCFGVRIEPRRESVGTGRDLSFRGSSIMSSFRRKPESIFGRNDNTPAFHLLVIGGNQSRVKYKGKTKGFRRTLIHQSGSTSFINRVRPPSSDGSDTRMTIQTKSDRSRPVPTNPLFAKATYCFFNNPDKGGWFSGSGNDK